MRHELGILCKVSDVPGRPIGNEHTQSTTYKYYCDIKAANNTNLIDC